MMFLVVVCYEDGSGFEIPAAFLQKPMAEKAATDMRRVPDIVVRVEETRIYGLYEEFEADPPNPLRAYHDNEEGWWEHA